jgi:glycosyltransferase involved in cell wall biosynthesis
MACGTPVVTSNTSAMPEIAGEGAILIDPKRPATITEAMLKLEENSEWYKEQVDYGLERAKKFSWRHTAEALFEVYKEVAANK